MLRLTSGVDLSRATSGIIQDMGRPFADLALYNGQPSPTNRCSYRDFERVYTTLVDAQVPQDTLQSPLHPCREVVLRD